MLKAGKKTLAWNQARAELKKEFEARGITSCELGYQECWRNNALSFAHLYKRKDVKDLKEVVLACTPCHEKVEYNPNMTAILQHVIDSRKTNFDF